MVICALAGCAFAGFLVIRQAYHPNTTNGGLLNYGWFSPRVEKSLTTDLLTPTANHQAWHFSHSRSVFAALCDYGTFTLSNSREHFEVVLRTNLSSPGASSTYEKREGVVVEFDKDRQVFSISNHTPAPTGGQLAKAPFSFITGQPYSFTITDTGTSVTVLIDGANSLPPRRPSKREVTRDFTTANYRPRLISLILLPFRLRLSLRQCQF